MQTVIGDELQVAAEEFVVGDFDGHVGELPLPGAAMGIAFDDGDRELGSPEGEFALPIGDKRFWADQECGGDFAGVQEHADGGDGLHGFAEAHFVGEDCGDTRVEKSDALQLKRKRLERKVERAAGHQCFQ